MHHRNCMCDIHWVHSHGSNNVFIAAGVCWDTFNERKCFAVLQPVEEQGKLKEGAGVTEDANESMVWSPAPVVYGIVNNNLLLSLSICVHSPSFIPRMQLSSKPECDVMRGNQHSPLADLPPSPRMRRVPGRLLPALIICWMGGTVWPWWRATGRRSPLGGCPSPSALTWPPPRPRHGSSGRWGLPQTRGWGPESCAEWPVPGSPWAQTSLSCAPLLRDINKWRLGPADAGERPHHELHSPK